MDSEAKNPTWGNLMEWIGQQDDPYAGTQQSADVWNAIFNATTLPANTVDNMDWAGNSNIPADLMGVPSDIDSSGTSGGKLPGSTIADPSNPSDLGGWTPDYMPSGLADIYSAWASGTDGLTYDSQDAAQAALIDAITNSAVADGVSNLNISPEAIQNSIAQGSIDQ